jgi:hypothetical protein
MPKEKQMAKMIILAVSLIVVPLVAKADCSCIKNADGKCMTLGRGVYPWRQFDEYISGPHCVTGCYPGYSDVYGYSEQTKKELVDCRIDWKRLRHDLGRDDFAQWQW